MTRREGDIRVATSRLSASTKTHAATQIQIAARACRLRLTHGWSGLVWLAIQPEGESGLLVSRSGQARLYSARCCLSRSVDDAVCHDCLVRMACLERRSFSPA